MFFTYQVNQLRVTLYRKLFFVSFILGINEPLLKPIHIDDDTRDAPLTLEEVTKTDYPLDCWKELTKEQRDELTNIWDVKFPEVPNEKEDAIQIQILDTQRPDSARPLLTMVEKEKTDTGKKAKDRMKFDQVNLITQADFVDVNDADSNSLKDGNPRKMVVQDTPDASAVDISEESEELEGSEELSHSNSNSSENKSSSVAALRETENKLVDPNAATGLMAVSAVSQGEKEKIKEQLYEDYVKEKRVYESLSI
jgi:hypothetical protein